MGRRAQHQSSRLDSEADITNPYVPEFVLSLAASDATVVRGPPAHRGTAIPSASALRFPRRCSSIRSDKIKPLVASGDHILVGEVERRGRRIVVVADPDLLANAGLAKPVNAAFALALIGRLRTGSGRACSMKLARRERWIRPEHPRIFVSLPTTGRACTGIGRTGAAAMVRDSCALAQPNLSRRPSISQTRPYPQCRVADDLRRQSCSDRPATGRRDGHEGLQRGFTPLRSSRIETSPPGSAGRRRTRRRGRFQTSPYGPKFLAPTAPL